MRKFWCKKEFETAIGTFAYNRIPQKIFMLGVHRIEGDGKNPFMMASPAKALADYMYVKKLNWESIPEASESLRIDSNDFGNITRKELNEFLANYNNKRVKRFIKGWINDLI